MASLRPHTSEPAGRSIGRMLSSSIASATSPLAGWRSRNAKSAGVIWLSGILLLAGVAVGVLISANWQAQSAGAISASSPITRQSGREIIAATIQRLESEQADLKKQIADLRTQLNNVQNTDAERKSTLQDLNNDITQQRIASGMMALHGPGVIASFNDSTVRSIPEGEDPAKYILHDYDLRDILNTLWIAGAEAVSLNGERIVSNTSLYCVGTTVICNATRLSPPYEIHAIGDPQALEAALRGSSQMEKFNDRAKIYDLPVQIVQNQEILVPAYNGSFVFKYATVPGQK
jgi:uncharacterized protein YlxW (UPF0749 family)